MPIIRASGKKVRVTFSVKRPRGAKALARLAKAMEKVVKKHGGKIKKKPK